MYADYGSIDRRRRPAKPWFRRPNIAIILCSVSMSLIALSQVLRQSDRKLILVSEDRDETSFGEERAALKIPTNILKVNDDLNYGEPVTLDVSVYKTKARKLSKIISQN